MDNIIEEFESLRKQISDLDPCPDNQDFGKLDYLLKKLALVTRRTFGITIPYLEDLKKIHFPENSGIGTISKEVKDQLEYKWVVAQDMIDNLVKIMIEDLTTPQTSGIKESRGESKSIFIVHGPDEESVKELKAILQQVGIKPIILHEQPSKGMTIIEKLEEYSDVGFAFVILTPDDLGLSKEVFFRIFMGEDTILDDITIKQTKDYLVNYNNDKERADLFLEQFDHLKARARQNVILEFGYFIGKLRRSKVCCLHKGEIEQPSDMHGICYVHFLKSVNEVKDVIIGELRAAELID